MAKRKRGQKYRHGFTKRKILLTLLDNPKKGILEQGIREQLKKYGIHDRTGIRKQLEFLEREGLAKREDEKFERKDARTNLWKLNISLEKFRTIAEICLKGNGKDHEAFLTSKYMKIPPKDAGLGMGSKYIKYKKVWWEGFLQKRWKVLKPAIMTLLNEVKKPKDLARLSGVFEGLYDLVGNPDMEAVVKSAKRSPHTLYSLTTKSVTSITGKKDKGQS